MSDRARLIQFFVPGIPRTKNKPWAAVIGGKPRLIQGSKDRERLRAFAAVAGDHAPAAPWAGPVVLSFRFVFPVPKSWPKWKREAALEQRWRHTSKPDATRLQAFAEDALSGVFFTDDAYVDSISSTKGYGTRPGAHVYLELLDQAVKP